MAIILGYPGPWHAMGDTGVDRTKVVHGEQGFVIHRPLPVEGTVMGRTRVTGIVDKVTLGGQSYDCAGVRGTTACHWIAPGTIPEAPAPAKR